MRATEFLTELEVDRGILDIMRKKGYKELGHGQDQLVFLEPRTKMILKIFGTNSSQSGSAGSTGLTFPQETFKAYADFCAANPDNPFLPYFSGWETFEFKGKRYLQIRCERLFKGSQHVEFFHMLEEIARAAKNDRNGAKAYLDDMIGDPDDDYNYNDVADYGPMLTLIGGEEGFYKFWDTLYQLGKIADRGGFHVDLHDENFMLGSDGEIVISDPFFSGWGKRER